MFTNQSTGEVLGLRRHARQAAVHLLQGQLLRRVLPISPRERPPPSTRGTHGAHVLRLQVPTREFSSFILLVVVFLLRRVGNHTPLTHATYLHYTLSYKKRARLAKMSFDGRFVSVSPLRCCLWEN